MGNTKFKVRLYTTNLFIFKLNEKDKRSRCAHIDDISSMSVMRIFRDENFNPDACSAIRGEATTFDPLSDDELCVDRSTLEFDSPMHDSNELKTPNTVDMAEAFTSSPFEFKLPQEPDRKNYRGRTECEAVVEDCAPTYLEKATKRPSPYRPKKSDDFRRKYQNSIFCSSLSENNFFSYSSDGFLKIN